MSWFLLSMMKALFSWSLLLVLLPFGLEISDASETQFQILDMSPYYSSSASGSFCQRSSKTGLGFDNRLEVVHKHGPCAQNYEKQSKLSFAKILDNDKLRVKSIQARVAHSINTNKLDPNKLSSWNEKDKLPIRADGDYIVTIGLGTPEQSLSLIFDTGSDIMWTQCQPCTKGCYKQNDPIFDPRLSKTYSNISCSSKQCPHDPSSYSCYRNVTCLYGVQYGDGSYTEGFLGKDNLTVTQTHVFPHFLFGCGIENDGVFTQNVDGILGLSRDPISFVSQTAQKYGQYFSYCLPKNLHSTGFLAFGKTKKDDNAKIVSTPFVRGSYHNFTSFYFIEIITISVGRKRLAINGSVFKKAGTVIDSGTVITRLPPAAYNVTRKEFKKQMNKNKYKSAPAYYTLDTCFYISRNTKNAKIPIVSFIFKGNARVDLDASGTLWVVNSTYACLAFIGNSGPDSLAIFGNTQQKKYEVSYDVAGMKLGFKHNPKCN